jgi:CBS domain-containing protein
MLVKRLSGRARERLVTVPYAAPLIEAAKLLRLGKDIVVVCDDSGTIAGVITKTDVVSQLSHCRGSSCVTPASNVMAREIVTCSPDDGLSDVWETMKRRRLKNIPIIDADHRPTGVLNARDLLEVLLGEVENEEALLRDYVMGIGYQ